MTNRRPRTVFAAAVVLLLVVLGIFVYGRLESVASDREEVERRFAERARVSAALTESLFGLAAGQGAQDNRRLFGDREVDAGALSRQIEDGDSAYGAVLDDEGRILAATEGVTPAIRAHLESRPFDVDAALSGRPFGLSDFVEAAGGDVLEYAAPFNTDYGRRVMVTGFRAEIIGLFLGGYLARIPDADQATAYVLDSNDLVVGTPSKDQMLGEPVHEPGLTAALGSGEPVGTFDSSGDDRAYATSTVESSTWRVVLSMNEDRLYAGTGATIEWVILLALAAVGVAAIYLLLRMVRAAAQVQQAYERLGTTHSELERSNAELRRSNAELEQFASVASHDLQEPLRKVRTFGDKLEQRFGDEIPEEAHDYLRRMRRAAARMSALIEDLLRFSRVTTHATPPRPVELARVANEVVSDLDAVIHETGGTVQVGPLPTLEADPLQMRQLLQNLIANGLKFHRADVAPEVRVEALAAPDGAWVGFTVADNGIGFEQQYAERIFRVFERLHGRDVYEGTGIGLALCRKIVERHGGEITAAGVPGAGATFTVTLPARQSAAPPGDGHRPAAGGPAKREPAHA